MRTILHIGMSKTGTTALQESLARSRPVLAARGVLYPRGPRGGSQRHHQVLACGLAPFQKLPREFHSRYPDAETARAAYRAFVARLSAQVAEARPSVLVLSGEALFRALGETGARNLVGLIDRLGGAGEGGGGGGGGPRIAAYVRQPSAHVLSHVQQAMRYSHRPRVLRGRAVLEVLDAYATLFGSGAVDARAFRRDRLAGGDVVADFCARHLADRGIARGDLALPDFANESLSAEACDISRRYRLAFHEGSDRFSPDSKGLLRALARIDAETGAPRPRLQPGLAEAIDHASPEPLALRDRYGIEFAGIDYDRLARGDFTAPPPGPLPLGRILALDAARGRAVLAALAGDPWAREAPERGGWIAREDRDLAG